MHNCGQLRCILSCLSHLHLKLLPSWKNSCFVHTLSLYVPLCAYSSKWKKCQQVTWNYGHYGKPLMSTIRDFRGTLEKREGKNTKYSYQIFGMFWPQKEKKKSTPTQTFWNLLSLHLFFSLHPALSLSLTYTLSIPSHDCLNQLPSFCRKEQSTLHSIPPKLLHQEVGPERLNSNLG